MKDEFQVLWWTCKQQLWLKLIISTTSGNHNESGFLEKNSEMTPQEFLLTNSFLKLLNWPHQPKADRRGRPWSVIAYDSVRLALILRMKSVLQKWLISWKKRTFLFRMCHVWHWNLQIELIFIPLLPFIFRFLIFKCHENVYSCEIFVI